MVVNQKKAKNQNLIAWSVAIIAVVLVLVVIISFMNKPEDKVIDLGDKEIVVPIEDETGLDLDSEIKFLTDCLAVSGIAYSERPEELRNCPNIKKEEVDKLTLMNHAPVELSCSSFGKDDNGESYKSCFSRIEGCDVTFNYFWIVPQQEDKRYYYLYECREGYYYSYSHSIPQENLVMKVELDKETFRKIKLGY